MGAVPTKGSYICLQLWALGRAVDLDILRKQDPPRHMYLIPHCVDQSYLVIEDEIKE